MPQQEVYKDGAHSDQNQELQEQPSLPVKLILYAVHTHPVPQLHEKNIYYKRGKEKLISSKEILFWNKSTVKQTQRIKKITTKFNFNPET